MSAMSRKDAMSESRPARLSFPLAEPKEEPAVPGGERPGPERTPLDEYNQLNDLRSSLGRLSRLMLAGGSLVQLLDMMEQMLGNPVAVVGSGGACWRSAGVREGEAAQIAEAAAACAGRESCRAGSGALVPAGAHRMYIHWVAGGAGAQTAVALLERSRPLLPLDTLSLARMSAFVELEMANIEAVREVEGKYLELFLQDWLAGKIVSERDWKLRAEVCGCELGVTKPLQAVVVGSARAAAEPERSAELARALLAERYALGGGLLAVPFERELVLIVPEEEPAMGGEAAEGEDASGLRQWLGKLKPLLGLDDLRLFAGKAAARPEQLPASLAQARRAKRVADICGLADDVVTYDRLGVYALLYLIPDGEEREQFLRRYALPLRQADRKGGGRLTETLEMFFRCNGNIKLTSEKLYAHYNTVVYRLDKIQTLLGVSLDDPEDRLQLQLSLKLGQIAPEV